MKGKVRRLTFTILVIGVIAFSPTVWRAWANPDVITIGPGATDRPNAAPAGYTLIAVDNPANLTGTLDTVEVWATTSLTGLRVGTFYLVSGTTYKCRDSADIGAVTFGAKRTYTSLSISVEAGDYLGCYYTIGTMERNDSGGGGYYNYLGESIDANDQADFTFTAGRILSIYATGETTAPPAGGGGQMIIIEME